MRIKLNPPPAWRRARVLLVGALVVLTHLTAHADDVHPLNVPVGALGLPKNLHAELNRHTRAEFSVDFDKVPVRRLLTRAFHRAIDGSNFAGFGRELRLALAAAGYPMDLSDAELSLLYNQPNHPVFTRLTDLRLPGRLGNVMPAEVKEFVIDAIHALDGLGYYKEDASRPDNIQAFDAILSRHLGRPSATFRARVENETFEKKMAPDRPTLAECRRALATLSDAQMNEELLRLAYRRHYPDGNHE